MDAFVRSAHGAGTFYEGKAKVARDLNSKIANEDRDEDRHGRGRHAPTSAERAREFAAQMALQAYALLAAAEGAVDAYAQVTGSDWKPYEGSSPPRHGRGPPGRRRADGSPRDVRHTAGAGRLPPLPGFRAGSRRSKR
ncbi:MAG: hypothetical protein WKF40_09925 [Thermoleophilaceae bacterium]